MSHNYDIQNHFVSSLDIRSKLALFIQFTIWSFLFNHPVCHLTIGILVISTGLTMGLSLPRLFSKLLPLLPIFVMIIFFTGFTGGDNFVHEENRIILFTLWTKLEMTRGGLMFGMTFLFRLTNMIVLTIIILESTALDDFINLFIKLKFPHSLSFVITTAIRFVPELDKKRNLIINAQRARGIDMNKGGWVRHFKVHISIMIPLIINSIIMADQLTMGLLNRGFGYKNEWTILSELKLKPKDYLILVICLISLISGVTLKIKTDWGLI
ncbi:energy-coupling factor transporter transmembrane component T family protein [Desulfobacula sp.]